MTNIDVQLPPLQYQSIAASNVNVRIIPPSEISNYDSFEIDGTGLGNHPGHDLRWLKVLSGGLRQQPYLLEARRDDEITGWLPLILMRSILFGRFLVSLPYISTAGVQAHDEETADALIERAGELTGELDCRYLELRHESSYQHSYLTAESTAKVHMRLTLPESVDELWESLKAKVRNQVRKGERNDLKVFWGGEDLLSEFYSLFSRRMRDLGTPVYSRRLFEEILASFPEESEICVVRAGSEAAAAAILVHSQGVTEVPSASSLAKYNRTNANMLMYWHLLSRAVERNQDVFDFGRCSPESSTFRFKKQWGAESSPAVWQYYLREGSIDQMRPENKRHQQLIKLWRRLPLAMANCMGPVIVRGIP